MDLAILVDELTDSVGLLVAFGFREAEVIQRQRPRGAKASAVGRSICIQAITIVVAGGRAERTKWIALPVAVKASRVAQSIVIAFVAIYGRSWIYRSHVFVIGPRE
jgi:hypothetical protein